MAAVSVSNAGLIELGRAYLAFKYFAIDSNPAAYELTQTGPLTEVTTNGGQRSMGTATIDGSGVVTLSKQFVFTGTVVVKAICPMNSATAGLGTMLTRYIPASGSLPDSFNDGGSLLVTFTASLSRPA